MVGGNGLLAVVEQGQGVLQAACADVVQHDAREGPSGGLSRLLPLCQGHGSKFSCRPAINRVNRRLDILYNSGIPKQANSLCQ